jgi:hypothetical protein
MLHRILPAAVITPLLLFLARPARAQSATFAGGVVRDTLGHGISGVQVTLPDRNRRDTTDERGEFKFTGLAPGRAIVNVRRVGFQAMADTVMLVNGADVEREYVMDVQAFALDSMRVLANTQPKNSIKMAEFEEHRKSGVGHFIMETELRKNDSRKLEDVITSVTPGLRVYRPDPAARPTGEYLASLRASCNGPAFSCGGSGTACPVTLYVDGLLYYNPASTRAATATPASASARSGFSSGIVGAQDFPDMSRFSVRDYSAVEFYAGGASAPEKYNATTNACGVLLLWTRDR